MTPARVFCAAFVLGAIVAAGATHADDGIDLPIDKPARGRALEPKPERAPRAKSEPPTPAWWEAPPRVPGEPPGPLPEPPPTPPEFFGQPLVGDLVFILDRSGSMHIEHLAGRSRWETVRDETLRAIDAMPAAQRFDLVVFSSFYWPLWGETRPATPENKAAARTFLGALEPGGGTYTGPATAWAVDHYRLTRTFALLSDGLAADARLALELIDRQTDADQHIDTFGLALTGGGEQWLKDVATATGGSYTQVR